MSEQSALKNLSPDAIERNPDNPRLFFRSDEMETLLHSVKAFGIQVPITVYAEGQKFVLIDGERRWRCALKLNMRSIPALVQAKPSPLNNLLLMFNIHALREQWDYFTIANKLPDVEARFRAENGRAPSEADLSQATGLTRGQIRRCRLMLQLPPKYIDLLRRELGQPKQRQRLTEDFFLEMERALKAVNTHIPGAILDMDGARDTLIDKFRRGEIRSVTDFRQLAKIATAVKGLGVPAPVAVKAIQEIVSPDARTGINDTFSKFGFDSEYGDQRILLSTRQIAQYLAEADAPDGNTELREELVNLAKTILKLFR